MIATDGSNRSHSMIEREDDLNAGIWNGAFLGAGLWMLIGIAVAVLS